MGEFYGSLQDIGVPEILSFLKGLSKTGSLRLSQGRWAGEVGLNGGRVIGASFNSEQGVAALQAMMLGLPAGSFTFTDGQLSTDQNIDVEHDEVEKRLTLFDVERAALAPVVPSLAAVPRVAKALGTTGEVVLDAAAIETLLAVNGERTIADISGAHGLVQTARELAKLVESGLITIDVPEAEQGPARDEFEEVHRPERSIEEADRTVVDVPNGARVDPRSIDERQAAERGNAAASSVASAPGSVNGAAAAARPRESEEEAGAPVATAPGPCPKLGYVDDPSNRYSRPTQLHRCFASGAAERVSTPEQRDLCLTNRYPNCPRFVAGGATVSSPASTRPAPPAEVERQPVETRAGRFTRPSSAPQSRRSNGGSAPTATPPRPRAPISPSPVERMTRPLPRPVPHESAVARQSSEEAAPEPAARQESSYPEAGGPISQRGEPLVPSLSPRRLIPAVLLVTVAAIAVVAVVVMRGASGPLFEASEAEGRLGTAGAPDSGSAPGDPSSLGSAVPLRTAFEVRFAEGPAGWPNDPSSTAWFADGGYRVFARTPGQFVAIGAPTTERFGDMVVSATFRKVGGPAGGGYGFIIRDQGPGPRDGVNQNGQYYVLEVGDRGEYGIWRREGDRWLDLIPWTPSDVVPRGNATNELMVQANGQELTFLVNGRVLAHLVGAVLRDGGVGIFVGGDLNEVVVERFSVQTPT